ncbi:MAG: hypothetical protein OIF47_01355 [Marinibacterium sp.]|nr:hypothetical protein [Marinibacterium sp.]
MSKWNPVLKGTVAAIFVTVMFSIPLPAQSADPTDESMLLEQLSQADPADAARLDRQLRALWDASGSPAMDLLLRRGRDAMAAGDVAQAIEHLTALTDHAPAFAEGYHARAAAYFEAGLYGPALADLERTLALNPNHYLAIYGLGTILETFGEPELAYEAYSRVLAIHPHHDEVTKAADRLRPDIEGKAL